jgi:hypothetical protein
MKTVTLFGHVEGQSITLDEPFDLPVGAKVLVTILPDDLDRQRSNWYGMSKRALARAYSDDEPDYPLPQADQSE